jgi:hypothetical protein
MPQPSLSQPTPSGQIELQVSDYDLDATMTSGQVFGWEQADDSWIGVVNGTWVRLQPFSGGIRALTGGIGPPSRRIALPPSGAVTAQILFLLL